MEWIKEFAQKYADRQRSDFSGIYYEYLRPHEIEELVTTQITKAYQDGIDDAIEAAKTEYLQDATCDSEDVAYDQAISDAILAIRALKTTI